MKKRIVARSHFSNRNRDRIIQLCFDAQSIDKFTPGLKMIFALDDPPLFVKLEEIDSEVMSGVFHAN